MVYLNCIYTKSGDGGETSLGDGTRVPKTHPRIVAYGGIDELNACLGAARAGGECTAEHRARLATIQNDLFDVGADLCVPETDRPQQAEPLRVRSEQVQRLEEWIDQDTEQLKPLKSFVLPGGTPAAALLHQARTVCRRAEIGVLRLAREEPINPEALCYLNRLSDLLFTMARMANGGGSTDVQWIPGGER